MRRIGEFLVRNWPLKLAALALATLLYTGLALSQGSSEFRGSIPVFAVNQPDNAVLITPLREVTRVSYVATTEVGTLTADDFRATVDLSRVDPDGGRQSVLVDVEALPRGITVVSVDPERIQVELDRLVEATVPVLVDYGPPPPNAEVGTVRTEPASVTVRGAESIVREVVAVRATIGLDATGLNYRGDVRVVPVDRDGQELQVDVVPETVLVTVPVFSDRRQRTLPVNPVVTGTPGAGYRIATVTVEPQVLVVEGDADELAPLTAADTQPISVSGRTADLNETVALSLPDGVVPLEATMVRVRIQIVPITETRTYAAGVAVRGLAPGASSTVSTDRVLVTLFGPVAILDDLGARPLVAVVDATGRTAGSHELPASVQVPSGVSVADISPETVTVTIMPPPTPTPSPTPVAPFTPAPSPSG